MLEVYRRLRHHRRVVGIKEWLVSLAKRFRASTAVIFTKENLAITISCAAFLLSFWTTLSSTFRQVDDISLTASIPPTLGIENRALVLDEIDMQVVFINAGNRSAAMNGFYIAFRQSADETGANCTSNNVEDMLIATDFEPFTLKEKEIAIRNINVVSKGSEQIQGI